MAAQPASVPIKGPEGEGAIALGPFDLDWFTKSLLSSRETIAHAPRDEGDVDVRALVAGELGAPWNPLSHRSVPLVR